MINRGVVGCQIELKPVERGQRAADKLKGIVIPTDLSSRSKRESQRIFSRGLDGHEILQEANLRRLGPLSDKA
jgi:hypothetical protein